MENNKNEAKSKKPIYKKWWFWLLIIVVIGIVGGSAGSGEGKTKETDDKKVVAQKNDTKDEKKSEKKTEKTKEKVVYDKNNIVIKITDYEFHSILGYLEVKMYIENNSEKDLNFSLDGDVTLNDYTLSAYLFEEINKGTKKNVSLDIQNLNENNIEEKDLSTMSFKMDIYHSDNYMIDDRIEDDLKIKYKFK